MTFDGYKLNQIWKYDETKNKEIPGKLTVMAKILWDKFEGKGETSQRMKEELLKSGTRLLVYHPTDQREGDSLWGDQPYRLKKKRRSTWRFSDTKKYNERGKGGDNYLGRLLMYIRYILAKSTLKRGPTTTDDKYYLKSIIDGISHDTAYHEYGHMEEVFKHIIPDHYYRGIHSPARSNAAVARVVKRSARPPPSRALADIMEVRRAAEAARLRSGGMK